MKRLIIICLTAMAIAAELGVAFAPAATRQSASTSLLSVTRYAPNPGRVLEATVPDLPVQPIDPANLSVTFTLRQASSVIVRLQAWHDTVTTHAPQIWGLLENGNLVPGSGGIVDRTVQQGIGADNPWQGDTGKFTSMDIYLPHVRAGRHTYTWGWYDGINMRFFIGDGTTPDAAGHIWPPAIMEVWTGR